MTATPGRTQGETHGIDQEPTTAGDQDPAKRDPRPDGPMNQPVGRPNPTHAGNKNPEADVLARRRTESQQ
jgi:hypothetical protein